MNSEFIVKVRKLVNNIKIINDEDIIDLDIKMSNLINEIESTIVNYPEIGLRQLRSNFNEIRQQFIYTEENVLRRLSELDKEGKDEYFSDYANTKEVGVKNEEALSCLLELLLTYFPDVAKNYKTQYKRFLPNKIHLLIGTEPITKNVKSEEIEKIKNHGEAEASLKSSKLPKLLFDSPETRESLFAALKGLFPGKEDPLKEVLEGKPIEEKLLFSSQQNSFTEVFSRLRYNNKILNELTEVRDWICTFFEFRYKKGSVEEIRSFSKNSVYDTLTRKSEPRKENRILKDLEWLPFIPKNKLKENT